MLNHHPAESSGVTAWSAKRSNASATLARATNSRAAWPATAWGWRFGSCDLGLFAAGQQRRGIGQHAHGYDTDNNSKAMGLLYALSVDTEDGTTTVQVEANSKEEALESGEELYPGCRLALVNPKCAEDQI